MNQPNRPFYWGDEGPVPLYSGRIELQYPSGTISLAGDIHMDWLPSPRLVWAGSTDDATSVQVGLKHLLAGTSEEPDEIRLPDANPLPSLRPPSRVRKQSGSYSSDGQLPPRSFSNGKAVHTIVCDIINALSWRAQERRRFNTHQLPGGDASS